MENHRNGLGSFVRGLFIGSAVGAAIGILRAPQSGEETMALIRRKTTEAKAELESAALNARLRAEELLAEVQAKSQEIQRLTEATLAEQRAKIEAAADAGRRAYKETKVPTDLARSSGSPATPASSSEL